MRRFRLRTSDVPVADVPSALAADEEKTAIETKIEAKDASPVDFQAQHGVRGAQAVTQVWTRNQLLFAYAK
jgi:hypothetical protein